MHIFKTNRHSNVEQGFAKTPIQRFSPKAADERSNNTEPITVPDYSYKQKTKTLKDLAAEYEAIKGKIDQMEKANNSLQGEISALRNGVPTKHYKDPNRAKTTEPASIEPKKHIYLKKTN